MVESTGYLTQASLYTNKMIMFRSQLTVQLTNYGLVLDETVAKGNGRDPRESI